MQRMLRAAVFVLNMLPVMAIYGQGVRISHGKDTAGIITPRTLWDGKVRVEGQGFEVPGVDLLDDNHARCMAGDDPAYAQRNYPDTGWTEWSDALGRIVPGSRVKWVRIPVIPAKELRDQALFLNVQVRGAFTLFLNGQEVQRSNVVADLYGGEGESPASVPRYRQPISFLCDGKVEVLALRIETRQDATLASTDLRVSIHAGDSTYHQQRILLNYGVFIGINIIIFLMALLIGWSERRDRGWLLLAALSIVSVLDTVCTLGGSMGVLGLPGSVVTAFRLMRVLIVPWGMYLLILVLAEFRGELTSRPFRRYTVGIGWITLSCFAVVAMFPAVLEGRNITIDNIGTSVQAVLAIALFILVLPSVCILVWFAIAEVRLGIRLWRSKGYERWLGAGAVSASLLAIILTFGGAFVGLGLSTWFSVLAEYCSFVAVPVSVAIYLSIRSGHHTRLVTRQRDELDREVQDRTAELRTEKERSDELLLNILPHEVAEELKNTGTAEAKHFDQATVLFSDFRGFTQLSEKLSPEQLVREIDTCFKHFDGLMDKWGMEKIKTIGDAYMAAGGLPDPGKGSPADVVHAALEMQEFMEELARKRTAHGLPVFHMRVGIHTGPVVAGIVGVKKFQYDIWGDTVNTASRMESSGEVGQVNISGATYALVKDVVVSSQLSGARTTDNEQLATLAFNFIPRGKVQAKGKGEMEMYFVRRSSSGA